MGNRTWRNQLVEVAESNFEYRYVWPDLISGSFRRRFTYHVTRSYAGCGRTRLNRAATVDNPLSTHASVHSVVNGDSVGANNNGDWDWKGLDNTAGAEKDTDKKCAQRCLSLEGH